MKQKILLTYLHNSRNLFIWTFFTKHSIALLICGQQFSYCKANFFFFFFKFLEDTDTPVLNVSEKHSLGKCRFTTWCKYQNARGEIMLVLYRKVVLHKLWEDLVRLLPLLCKMHRNLQLILRVPTSQLVLLKTISACQKSSMTTLLRTVPSTWVLLSLVLEML